jgi:hypothetical protein
MIRKLPDGSWEFDTIDEAIRFVEREDKKHSHNQQTQIQLEIANDQEKRPTTWRRLKPTEKAKVINTDELLQRSGLRNKDAHNLIYQQLKLGAEQGAPWYTNKDLTEILRANNHAVTTIDVTDGITYLLTQDLIEEHPSDATRIRNNRYRAILEHP